jgi:hypothetical protein
MSFAVINSYRWDNKKKQYISPDDGKSKMLWDVYYFNEWTPGPQSKNTFTIRYIVRNTLSFTKYKLF